PHKIDLVARMGANYYCRASGNAVFEVEKPNLNLGIGVDKLPENIRASKVLTGNDLGILANCTAIPAKQVDFADARLHTIINEHTDHNAQKQARHQYAQQRIAEKESDKAWQILLH